MFDVLGLLLVAVLWGATNPFIRIASKSMSKDSGAKKGIVQGLIRLLKNWKYLLPLALNQFGSLLYVLVLRSGELTLAVPVTNSMTFVFTALSGWALGEARPNKDTVLGMLLVLLGTTLCWMDKTYNVYTINDLPIPKTEL